MIDDRREFERQAVLYDLRERVAVDGLRIVVAHLDQLLIRTCDFRVIGFPLFGEWLQDFALLGDPSCIRDDDLDGLFFRKVAEFIQHFLCGTDVNGRMGLDLPRFLPVREENVTISLVFRKHIMGVGCRAAWHPCLVGDLDDLAVQIL